MHIASTYPIPLKVIIKRNGPFKGNRLHHKLPATGVPVGPERALALHSSSPGFFLIIKHIQKLAKSTHFYPEDGGRI